MSSRDERAPFTRRALPVVALAAGVIAVWRSMDNSSANTVRVALRRQTTPTTHGTASAPTAPPNDQGSSAPAPTTIPSSTVCAHPRSIDGPTIDTRWGPVQVRAKLGTGDQLCSAHAIVTPSERDRSVWINEQAVPLLDGEIPSQGVNFDSIGGATYTSEGYRASLQAIIDGHAK
jgi:uncharacterized protein with FMN-binding domain